MIPGLASIDGMFNGAEKIWKNMKMLGNPPQKKQQKFNISIKASQFLEFPWDFDVLTEMFKQMCLTNCSWLCNLDGLPSYVAQFTFQYPFDQWPVHVKYSISGLFLIEHQGCGVPIVTKGGLPKTMLRGCHTPLVWMHLEVWNSANGTGSQKTWDRHCETAKVFQSIFLISDYHSIICDVMVFSIVSSVLPDFLVFCPCP